ncbi:MAG: folylpolyglutamate synthase/dihydrofolate synthase family protein [Pseudorhodoplanes sp.]|uniref:bifunctional folylpolyglutamate synthase/dihydrofolate synthase n=1 Tax=Pseudorhodoplanes sp. TaxID=1934341 RepID=UPI003D0D3732
MSALDHTLTRLLALHPKLIDLSLERMWRLLARLDHPERRLPPVIHVAGTNGKGSTIAFMRAILENAGHHVHVYTSPHLVRFNERFRIAGEGGGQLVGDDELRAVVEECERANAGDPITVFEITTAAGLVLFSRHPADVLLLEVGLGGRLDATNVVDAPLLSVITPVSLDHADYLGDRIESVAAEKAGILKRGVRAVIGPQTPEALSTIERAAERVRAPMRVAGEHWNASEEHRRLVYQDDDGLLDLPGPKLIGRHQFVNAGLAVAALRASGLKIPASAYEAGIVKADWPARMQRLTNGHLVPLAPTGSEIWLDGGHNPDGGRAIAVSLADIEERAPKPLVLIVGMLGTKDFEGYLRCFTGLARRLYAVPVPGAERSLSPAQIADAAIRIGIPAEVASGVEAALSAVKALSLEVPPRILIGGSLYLAGDVLRRNGTPPE